MGANPAFFSAALWCHGGHVSRLSGKAQRASLQDGRLPNYTTVLAALTEAVHWRGMKSRT